MSSSATSGQGSLPCHCTRRCKWRCCPHRHCKTSRKTLVVRKQLLLAGFWQGQNWSDYSKMLQINSEGVTRNFYPGDELPLWHEELEPQNSLLDILNTSSPEPMNIQWSSCGHQATFSIFFLRKLVSQSENVLCYGKICVLWF